MGMAAKKKTGRPKPLVHSPGLTKTKRRLGKGGKLKKTAYTNNRCVKGDTDVSGIGITS